MKHSYMLDTDICSYVIQGKNAPLNRAVRRHAGHLCMSAVTYHELQYGARRRGSRRIEESIAGLKTLVPVVGWQSEAAEIAAAVRCDLEARGVPIGVMDALIAGAALAEECTLVTNNMAHFSRVAGLRIENWA